MLGTEQRRISTEPRKRGRRGGEKTRDEKETGKRIRDISSKERGKRKI